MKTLVPDDLKALMDEAGQAVNWSVIAQQAFREVILNLAVIRETTAMDDAVERLRASKQSYVETERESGLEVGEEWVKEDAEYGQCCGSPRQWRRPEGKSTCRPCKI